VKGIKMISPAAKPVCHSVASEVVWDVLVKWGGTDLPCPFDLPEGIFDECAALS